MDATDTNLQTLHRATQELAMRCDGAHAIDGQGFNKFDAYFGKVMASTPLANWTPGKTYAIWKILGRYRKQLAGYGIDYAAIQPLTKPEPTQQQVKEIVLHSDNTLAILFPYDPILVHEVKQLVGRKWNDARKMWTVPLQLETVEAVLEFAAEHGFEVEDTITEMLVRLSEENEKSIEASKAKSADLYIEGLGGELKPFQRAGVSYALAKRRTFIADVMGLGKTVEALATIQAADSFPAVVVCPASLKLNWKRETERWLPGRSVAVVNGSPIDYENYDVLVVNYDILSKHLTSQKSRVRGREKLVVARGQGLLSGNPRTIVLDESHYCKNYKAKRTQLVQAMCEDIPYVLALTGTPTMNRPAELLSQLNIMDRLSDFGGFWHFAKRYCGAYNNRWGLDLSGATNLDELNNKLRATCFIRRTKEEVLKELPPKMRTYIPMPITNRKEYEKAEEDICSWIAGRASQDEEFLESISQLPPAEQAKRTQERMDTAEAKAAQAEHLVRIEALKQLAAAGKMEAVKEWIESFLETGEKLVVFATHHAVIDELVKLYPETPVITGDTPLAKRQEAVDSFQRDTKTALLFANIRAGGVGITLTAASNVAFIELDWTPAAHDQAEDRCHRIGQQDNVTAWYLLGEKTIDEDIHDLIEKKRKIVDAVTEGGKVSRDPSILKELIGRLRSRSAR
jgi:SWI/SNF-related matrix-associated actin-dependent regulator 1 of chromatin subfamily A